jgi:hypothetical protein
LTPVQPTTPPAIGPAFETAVGSSATDDCSTGTAVVLAAGEASGTVVGMIFVGAGWVGGTATGGMKGVAVETGDLIGGAMGGLTGGETGGMPTHEQLKRSSFCVSKSHVVLQAVRIESAQNAQTRSIAHVLYIAIHTALSEAPTSFQFLEFPKTIA